MDETRIAFSAPSWSIDSSFDHLRLRPKKERYDGPLGDAVYKKKKK